MDFWHRESKRISLERRIENIIDRRIAMADRKTFTEQLSSLKEELEAMTIGKQELIRKNWEELKIMGRG